MGINRVTKRGKTRLELRKRWPDGTTYRRYFPNEKKAGDMLTRIENSILEGTWRDLKKDLAVSTRPLKTIENMTVQEFTKQFLTDIKNRAKDSTLSRYSLSFSSINPELGRVPVLDLDRQRVYAWMHSRVEVVKPATVNRDLTALKRMYSWAEEIGLVDTHLLAGVKAFKEETIERRLLAWEEYQRVLTCSWFVPHSSRCNLPLFILLLGETGCRKSEALNLRLQGCDLERELVALNKVKGHRGRLVPMSQNLKGALLEVDPRAEYVLENRLTGRRVIDPKRGFHKATELAGVPWLQIHDLRRFRACQWAIGCVPVPTIQKLLGHQSLQTTQCYLKPLDPDFDRVRAAYEAENAISRGRHLGDSGQQSPKVAVKDLRKLLKRNGAPNRI